MTINEAYLIYFSPTHTSERVAEAIVRGTGIKNVTTIDLTLQAAEATTVPPSSLAVIAVPVYGGHVPPLAVKRLENICGEGTPVVAVVVYGNRAYEKALVELDDLVSARGFKVIAGATFVGEHSYSTADHPVAAGRPDESDLRFAAEFGEKVRGKIEAADAPDALYGVNVGKIRRPKQPFFPLLRFLRNVIKLRKSGVPLPRAAWVKDESLCVHCGNCAAHCPTGAIVAGDELHTDADKCIRCCACVKYCPKKVRVYDTPFGILLSDCFKKQKQPQIIL